MKTPPESKAPKTQLLVSGINYMQPNINNVDEQHHLEQTILKLLHVKITST